VVQVFAATNGYLDRIVVDKVDEFLEALTQRTSSEHSDLLEKIAGGDWSDDTQKAIDKAVAEFAEDFGYDLDEEGQPLDEDDDDEPAAKSASSNGGESKDDDDDEDAAEGGGEEASDEEKETAGV